MPKLKVVLQQKKMIPDGNLGDAERNEEQQKMVNIYAHLNYYFLFK